MYDWLGRLTSETHPESATTSYTYDANGNVATRTDARGVVVTSGYDALNRVTSRSYSDGTPSATFGYDGDERQPDRKTGTSHSSTYFRRGLRRSRLFPKSLDTSSSNRFTRRRIRPGSRGNPRGQNFRTLTNRTLPPLLQPLIHPTTKKTNEASPRLIRADP